MNNLLKYLAVGQKWDGVWGEKGTWQCQSQAFLFSHKLTFLGARTCALLYVSAFPLIFQLDEHVELVARVKWPSKQATKKIT